MISLLTSPGHSRRCLRHVCAAALATLLVATPLFADNCWDSIRPDSRYTVNSGNGTVVDNSTNFMWQQCENGLSGAGCATGTATSLNFDSAILAGTDSNHGGYNDWRVPLLDELTTLLTSPNCLPMGFDVPLFNHTVFNQTIFDMTWQQYVSVGWGVWSGSLSANATATARGVHFSSGYVFDFDKNYEYRIRLVRGNASTSLVTAAPQTLAFGTAPTLIKGASGSSVSVTSNGGGANSGNPIEYFSATPSVCDVGQLSGEVLVIGAAAVGDTCTILANQFGRIHNGVNYAPGQATQSMLIGCWDTHPDSRYVVNNGTVLDTATGLNGNNNLMWKQCVEGLSGASCVGTASTMSFDDAAIAGGSSSHANYNDWRAPTLAELQTLVPSACASGPYSPTINRTVFPATPSTATWTTTSTTTFFWLGAAVDFMSGSDSNLQVTNANPVRLVRGGLSLPSTPQTLAFGPAPSLLLGTSPAVSATNTAAINSGNPIRYSSATPLVCAVDGISGQITLTNTAAVGNTCTINADQYGRINNGVNYAPAAQVAQSLIVVAPVNGTCATLAPSTTAPVNATLCSAGTAANFASGVNTFTWACNGANGGSNVTTCSSIRQYTVTTNAGANGTLSCTTPVNGGATTTSTSTPNAGYRTASISGCNGTATAPGVNNYTTGAIIGDCQVSSTYEAMIDGICATPAASITAPANATLCSAGTAANFASGVNTFTWACDGAGGGRNVTACSSIRQYNVTTNAGANGTLSCTTPVNGGTTTTCTSTPNNGYRTASISGCNGTTTAAGINSYTTGAIVADCQVSGAFESLSQAIVWAPLNPSVRALDLVGSFAINPLAVGGASGNPVTYTSATPLVCSVSGMNGVNVTQLGLGVCTITANQQGDTIYSAATPVSHSVTFFATLDIDASGVGDTRYHALTDGQLIMRYLLNVTGPALTVGVTAQTALRTDPAVLFAHLNAMRNALDVDGNTVVDPATDGVLILRYLLGFRGSALIADAVATTPAPSRATALLIEQYLQGLTP